jgi:hypothetical protein
MQISMSGAIQKGTVNLDGETRMILSLTRNIADNEPWFFWYFPFMVKGTHPVLGISR